MTESEQIERLAKRYIKYLNLNEEKPVDGANSMFNIMVDNWMFSSYRSFLFGRNEGMPELSYNQIMETYPSQRPGNKIILYSSAEELDFKLSITGF